MIRDFDTVKLKRDFLNVRDSQGEIVSVPAGSVGTVVMIYDERVGSKRDKPGYEVDFCDHTGDTFALLTLEQEDIELDRPYSTMKKGGRYHPPKHKRKAS